MSKENFVVLKFLSFKESILVENVVYDKGNSVILIDKRDYVRIMKKLLLRSSEMRLTFTQALGKIN